MAREWRLVEQVEAPPALQVVGGHPLVARLLAQRGFGDARRAQAYLDPNQYSPASPYDLQGMVTAVNLLRETAAAGEKIRIWGDFDADGQTATAVLYEALIAVGAHVDYQLPRRSEGHGFHPRAIDDALRDGISTLITCDTAIGDIEVVARGVDAGLTIIVTDHHDLGETPPPAQAVVDPKMLAEDHPLHELAGVGVAYMVARALLEGSDQAPLLDTLLDLVAVGLVADVATQVDDVRYLIQRGLTVLRHTQRLGLRVLVEVAGRDLAHLDEQDIGFQLGPRLNAAGRLADAEQVVRLLLTSQEGKARRLAEKLEVLNRDRQARTEAMLAQVEEHLRRNPQTLHQPVIVLADEGLEPGVLGLVAGRLARQYDRPAILIAHREGQPSVASARSVEGIDIHEAIAGQRDHLLREGGHPMAAGFSIEREKVPAFIRGISKWLRENAPLREEAPPFLVDAKVPWEEISLELAHEVSRLAPFGAGNPRPVLMVSGGRLVRTEDVSHLRETPHRRLYINKDEGRPLPFTWFNAQVLPQIDEPLDIAFHIAARHWRGEEHLQLELIDWRPASTAPVGEPSRLVGGREVLDWRQKGNERELLSSLRATYGDSLWVWEEGLAHDVPFSFTRAELPGRPCLALAILTPPPEPEALRWVLAEAHPQRLYILPPRAIPEFTPTEFLKKVAGMVRVALRSHDGWIDSRRMAAHLGASQAAVVAALHVLRASGKIAMRHESGTWRAHLPQDVADGERKPSSRQGRSLDQARQALAYALREMRAYRQAYATQTVEALLYDEKLA